MEGWSAGTVERAEFSTGDVDVVRAMMDGTTADGLLVETSGDLPFLFEQTSATDGTVSVARMRFQGRVSAVMDGARQVMFTDIAEGRYDWRSRALRGDQERPLILPAGLHLAVDFEAVRSVVITVDAAVVSQWLARYGGLARATSLLQQAAAGSEAVRRAIRFYSEVMATGAFDDELVRARLLDVLLSVTAHHLAPAAAPEPARAAPLALTRAEEFLREHAGEAISTADVAAAAGLSIRGLHDQFRRVLDTTPSRYLRDLRLEGVHAALVEARETGTPEPVSAVARRWGFAHLGRFAALYARAYGELPSATLRADGGASGRP